LDDIEKSSSETGYDAPNRKRRGRAAVVFGVLGAAVGLGALATSLWVYSQTQRDILRLSNEFAQFRLSLTLLQQQGIAPADLAATATPSADHSAELTALGNRLAILEENWRNAPASLPAVALPTPEAPANPAANAGASGDCLPTGTRFLVAVGDSYPVCGTTVTVSISSVQPGFLSLGDGTVIASGGTIPLVGSSCMITAVSAGEEGMTEFGEVRVTC
jgi:hypothetical protein